MNKISYRNQSSKLKIRDIMDQMSGLLEYDDINLPKEDDAEIVECLNKMFNLNKRIDELFDDSY